MNMNSKYCTVCRQVFMGSSNICCDKEVEIFDPCKHGERLVSSSNSWIAVYNKWKDHPIFDHVAEECHENKCASAPTIMNKFIQTLLDNQRE
jgi:hypothetical protein